MCTTRLRTRAPELEQTRLKQGAWKRVREPGAAGGVRNTKDRDIPALEVRAGRATVGLTTRDAAGFLAAPTEKELKWPREVSEEQTAISLF